MKKLSQAFLTLIFLLFVCCAFADNQSSIVGNWLTIDDVTHQPRSIVQITDVGNETYQGKIIKVFYRPGEGVNDVCVKCTDPSHKGQKILGMVVLWRLQQTTANQWGNGQALDPDSGNIYRAKVALDTSGNVLIARGYIGISLLGRTQVWKRVDTQDNLIS